MEALVPGVRPGSGEVKLPADHLGVGQLAHLGPHQIGVVTDRHVRFSSGSVGAEIRRLPGWLSGEPSDRLSKI
jgi:hypothetical protein